MEGRIEGVGCKGLLLRQNSEPSRRPCSTGLSVCVVVCLWSDIELVES
jgi:hypothetical protein